MQRYPGYLFSIGLAAMLLGGTQSLIATQVALGETGDLRASAVSLDPHFSTPAPAIAYGSNPTATVLSMLGNNQDVDWYSFSGTAGQVLVFDVDNDGVVGAVIDQILSVFRADGTLLAYNDDGFNADPGSETYPFDVLDSLVGVLSLPATETYFIALSSYSNFADALLAGPTQSNLIPPGAGSGGVLVSGAPAGVDTFASTALEGYYSGNYRFHVSVGAFETSGGGEVPEASTWAAAAGITGLILARAIRRQRR